MRATLLALLLLAAAPATASAAAGALGVTVPNVKATLSGTCTTRNTLDHNGVVISSAVSCDASAACSCGGATRLLLETAAVLPGNGASGRERGTLTASGPTGSVTLTLSGTRTGLGSSSGTWTLGAVSGTKRAPLAPRGAYSAQTTTLAVIPGQSPSDVASRVRISAAIGCWNCPAQA